MSDPTPVPAAPAPKPGSSVLKIVLIVLGSIVLLFVLVFVGSIYACSHFIHKAIRSHEDKTTLNIPGTGRVTAGSGKTYTAADLGVDLYPGATAAEGNSSLDLPTGTMLTAVYSTPDPVSKVEAFYKGKLGSNSSDYTSGETAMLMKKISGTETVTITISSKDSQDGKTKIVILHAKKKSGTSD